MMIGSCSGSMDSSERLAIISDFSAASSSSQTSSKVSRLGLGVGKRDSKHFGFELLSLVVEDRWIGTVNVQWAFSG